MESFLRGLIRKAQVVVRNHCEPGPNNGPGMLSNLNDLCVD